MLFDEIVLPVLAEIGVPTFRNTALDNEVDVLFVLDAPACARTMVRIVANDEGKDLQLWTDIAAATSAVRPRMLELVNRLNSELRWLKFLLVQDTVLVVVDVALQQSRDPRGQFHGYFVAFLEALRTYWPEVARTASRRGKRSRLEREIDGVLAQQLARPADE